MSKSKNNVVKTNALHDTVLQFHSVENDFFDIVPSYIENNRKTELKVDFTELFNQLVSCKTKFELVTTFNRFGYGTTTKPTTTVNQNDLYIQLNDLSRIWLRGNRIDYLSTENNCNELYTELSKNGFITYMVEKSDNGCSKRSHRIECIPKTPNAFNVIMKYLLSYDRIIKIETV